MHQAGDEQERFEQDLELSRLHCEGVRAAGGDAFSKLLGGAV
tara:strand:- start:1103 stop:1228 length:126 start_codon:yes stop_codon:yes gene_type:complete